MKPNQLLRIVLLTALSCGCAKELPPEEPLRIGVLLPTDSNISQNVNGAAMVANVFNSLGGVLGRRVEILLRNSGLRPDIAREGARELVEEEGAVALVGGTTWFEYQGAYTIARDNGVPIIGHAGWPTFEEETADGYAFSVRPSMEMVFALSGRYAGTRCTRPALLSIPIEGTATSLVASFERESQEAGNAPVFVNDNTPFFLFDPDGLVPPLLDASPDCVFMFISSSSMAEWRTEWNARGGDPTTRWFIINEPLSRESLISADVDAEVVNGSFEITPPIVDTARPAWAEYRNRHLALYGSEPFYPWGAMLYDATALTLLGIESAGSTEGGAVSEAIARVSRFDGAGAAMERRFDSGELEAALTFVREGKDIDYRGVYNSMDFDPVTRRVEDRRVVITEVVDILTDERRQVDVVMQE